MDENTETTVEVIKTKKLTINNAVLDARMVEAEEVKNEWATFKLSNGDYIQLKVAITEVFDPGVKNDGEPAYHVKHTVLFRTIPREMGQVIVRKPGAAGAPAQLPR